MSTLPLTHKQLKIASRCDGVVSKVMQYTRQGWPNTVPKAFKCYWTRRNEVTIEAASLLWGTKVVISETCRDRILTSLHESHPGIVRMKSQTRSYVWWPGLDKDIEKLVKSCDPCS
uniref:Integrase zinc-binding domain-containing protein n=1 Tax=Amphimedon queenslandica TaxID=400682 RepID=A0A1X7VL64_AMPQE